MLTLYQHLALTLTYLNTKATQGQLCAILRLSKPTIISHLKDMRKRLESVGYQRKPEREQQPLTCRHLTMPIQTDTPENTNLNFDGPGGVRNLALSHIRW